MNLRLFLLSVLALHVTGALYAGAWRFSLKETLRAILNNPDFTATYDAATKTYTFWF